MYTELCSKETQLMTKRKKKVLPSCDNEKEKKTKKGGAIQKGSNHENTHDNLCSCRRLDARAEYKKKKSGRDDEFFLFFFLEGETLSFKKKRIRLFFFFYFFFGGEKIYF